MSRCAERNFTRALFVILLALPSVAPAQDRAATTAADVIQNAQQAYGPPPPEAKCDQGGGDEIVVCGEQQEQSQFRVKSSNELDPQSKDALNDGLPRAPDVSGEGIFKGPATIGSLCLPGLQKCPPPPAIFIDFTALPDAPEGSDADRISKGLPPLGNDSGTIPPADTGAQGSAPGSATPPPPEG